MSNIIDFNKAKERISETKAHAVQLWDDDQIRTELNMIAEEAALEYSAVLEMNSRMLESITYIETLNTYFGGLLMARGHVTGDFSAWNNYWENKERELVQLELEFNGDEEWED